MFNSYQYLFYNLYRINKNLFPKSEQPVLNAILLLSILLFANMLTIMLLVELFFGIVLVNFDTVSNWGIILFISAVLLINYLVLAYNKKYRLIIEYFDKKASANANTGNNKTTIVYISSSLIIFIIVIVGITLRASSRI